MSYPIFDTGYTLWAADLESSLMDLYGVSVRGLGVELRQLLDRYYHGVTVQAAVASLREAYGLASPVT